MLGGLASCGVSSANNMAMPASSLLMLAAAFVAVCVIAWLARGGRLSLREASEDECGAPVPGQHATGILLLMAAVGVMLAGSLGAGLGAAIVNTTDPTLGQKATVQWIAVGVGVLACAAIAVVWLPARRALGFGWSHVAVGARWGIIGSVLILPAVWGIGVVSSLVWRLVSGTPPNPIAHTTLSAMMEAERDLGWWLMVSAVVVAAPVFEELLYRGLLQGGILRTLWEMGVLHQPGGNVMPADGPAEDGRIGSGTSGGGHAWWAILMASSIFALLHAGVAAWIAMPSLLALGIALGWLRVRTGGLVAPIIVHAAFNAMNLGLASLSPAG